MAGSMSGSWSHSLEMLDSLDAHGPREPAHHASVFAKPSPWPAGRAPPNPSPNVTWANLIMGGGTATVQPPGGGAPLRRVTSALSALDVLAAPWSPPKPRSGGRDGADGAPS